MPDIRTLKQPRQGRIHIVGVSSGTMRMADVKIAKIAFPYDRYDGPYEATPSDEKQVIRTKDKLMEGNIAINPIPSNYGLITWDGTKIRVS